MSDPIKATVTSVGGGWYDVALPGTDPVRVQGKEVADAKAAELEAAAQSGEGSSLPTQSAEDFAAAAAAAAAAVKPAGDSPEVAALKAQLAASEEARTTAEAQLATRTVTTDGGTAPEVSAIPATVPRQYTGQMDPKQKKALEKMGVSVSTIILEENESIPPTGLFIGHNGRGYMILPGEEVDVPDFLLSVLDDAIMSAPIVDSKSQKVMGYRSRSKYPYRRI